MQKLIIKWQDPLNFAQKIAQNYNDENWAFLYSALSSEVDKSKSYIALFVKNQIIGNSFSEAQKIINTSQDKYFGWYLLFFEPQKNYCQYVLIYQKFTYLAFL